MRRGKSTLDDEGSGGSALHLVAPAPAPQLSLVSSVMAEPKNPKSGVGTDSAVGASARCARAYLFEV